MESKYYTHVGRKIGDFFIGFVGITALVGAVAVYAVPRNIGTGIALGVALEAMGVVISFSIGRRFIAIGMLSALLIPVLALGACFVALSGMRF